MATQYTWFKYLSELLSFARPYKKIIAIVVLFTSLSAGLDLMEPVVYKHVLNDLSGVYVHKTFEQNASVKPETLARLTKTRHHNHQIAPRTTTQVLKTLIIAAVLLFFINMISHLFDLVADYLSAKYANGVEQDFIEKLFEHVLRFKLSFFSKTSTGALVKKIDQTDQVGPAVTTFIEKLSLQVLKVFGAAGIMFYHNPKLAAASLTTIPFYLIISRKMAKDLEGTSESYLETWDDVETKLQDDLNHVKTVKVSGAENRVAQKFKQSLEEALSQYLSRSKMENTYIFFQNLFIHLGRLIVLIYGSYEVLDRRLTPGDVVMFVALLDQMYGPVEELTSHAINIQLEKVSITRALRLFHTGVEEKKGKEVELKTPSISFKDVNFSYVKGREVLHDLSFEVKPFTYTALVGKSGSGKSTVLDLMLNFYRPNSGEIEISGIPVHEISPSSLRSQMGLVSTEGAIFRGTVKENMVFKNPEATKKEILEAIEQAGFALTLKRLPHGLETPVGDQGIGLSVGERQRLQLARMLVSKPKIILLDEATANLDYATEMEVRNILHDLKQSCTILVVAHRFSMVEEADQVIVLNDGKIEAHGSIEEVTNKSEWFRSMALAHKEEFHGKH